MVARGVPGISPFVLLSLDPRHIDAALLQRCLLYTSDAADERSSVDLGGRRIIKKTKKKEQMSHAIMHNKLLIESNESSPSTE